MANQVKTALKNQTDRLIKTSAAIYAGLAVVAFVLMEKAVVVLNLNYPVAGDFAPTQLGYSPASNVAWSVEVRYLLVGVLAISSILLLILGSEKYLKRYSKTVRAKVSGYKWVYLALSLAPFIGLAYVVSGINDLTFVKIGELSVVLLALFAWMAERENRLGGRKRWLGYFGVELAAIAVIAPLLVSFIASALYGLVALDWFVYATGAVAVAGVLALVTNQYLGISGRKSFKDFEFAERNYFAIDLITKSTIAIVLIVGLLK